MKRQNYLTQLEYSAFGFKPVDDFHILLIRASHVLDNVTRSFYLFNDLSSDIPFRKQQFKKAVGCQIEFFAETGHVTTEGINSAPQSIQIGRTQITNKPRILGEAGDAEQSIVCADVFLHLSQTGLLHRGS